MKPPSRSQTCPLRVGPSLGVKGGVRAAGATSKTRSWLAHGPTHPQPIKSENRGGGGTENNPEYFIKYLPPEANS